jgi:adenylate cyclase
VEAERRQVTVLFADMVGFTTFSERSGEETAFTLMQNLAKLMEEAVHDHGGVVQAFTGDGIMAVFGAPVAFEERPLAIMPRGARHPHEAEARRRRSRSKARNATAAAHRHQFRASGDWKSPDGCSR